LRAGGRARGAGGRRAGAWGCADGEAAPERGAGGGRGGGDEKEISAKEEEKERKGEVRRELRVGCFSHLLCRVPAIRHSAKIFLKF
jgi:hypothetical protein